MKEIKVLLADDQTILRDGLASLLETKEDIKVVGSAGNGKEAIEKTGVLHPDVVLMDIRMPILNGVEAAKQIKDAYPDTVVIMLTTFDDDEYVIKAMTCGASGYLLKDIDSEKLVQAIRDGVNGSIILPGRIASKITSHLTSQPAGKSTLQMEDFSAREKDIITLLVAGKSNGEIGQSLFLTTGTVKNYLSQIYMKLDVKDRTNAVLLLKQIGF